MPIRGTDKTTANLLIDLQLLLKGWVWYPANTPVEQRKKYLDRVLLGGQTPTWYPPADSTEGKENETCN